MDDIAFCIAITSRSDSLWGLGQIEIHSRPPQDVAAPQRIADAPSRGPPHLDKIGLQPEGHDLMRTNSGVNLPLRQLPQHRMQNPAVAVVDYFNGRVDAAGGDEVDLVAVRFLRRDFHSLARF